MADEEDIVQRVRIEGEEDLLQVFARIGQEGKQAFTNIREAASNVAGAYRNLQNVTARSFQTIEQGGRAATFGMARIEASARAFGESIRNLGTVARTSFSAVASAISAITRTPQLQPLVNAFRTTFNGIRNIVTGAMTAIRQSLSAAFSGNALRGSFAQIEQAARRFGSSLREIGTAAIGFGRRIAVIAASATIGVAAFRALIRAATGYAQAQRSAAAEQTAALANAKSDSTALAGINRQTAEAQRSLNAQYGQGKLSLEDYTTALQDLDQQRQANLRNFLAQDAAEESARRRQQQQMAQLRESESFEQVAQVVGVQAANAFKQLGNTIDQVVRKAQQTLGPTLAAIVNGISNSIRENMPAIAGFFEEIRNRVAPLAKDFTTTFTEALPGILDFARGATTAITGIVVIVRTVIGLFNGLAAAINEVAGTNISGTFLLGLVAIAQFTRALPLAIALIRGAALAFGLLRLAMSGPVAILITLAAALVTYLAAAGKLGQSGEMIAAAMKSAFTDFIPTAQANVQAAGQEFAKLPGTAGTAAQGVATAVRPGLQQIPQVAKTNVDAANTELGKLNAGPALQQVEQQANQTAMTVSNAFMNIVAPVSSAFQQMADAAEQAARRIESSISGAIANFALGGPVGYAGGGKVRGAGTGTSDSILARLSNGEFVQRTAAVRHYGVDFMNALNSLRIPKDLLHGFASGGFVNMAPSLAPTPIMRFAEGGAVNAPRNALTLVLDGETFSGMLAPDNVYEGLKKKAVKRSLSPRKPNWF